MLYRTSDTNCSQLPYFVDRALVSDYVPVAVAVSSASGVTPVALTLAVSVTVPGVVVVTTLAEISAASIPDRRRR